MKKVALLTIGLMLLLPAGAQIMKSNSTTYGTKTIKFNTKSQNDVWYCGAGFGAVNTIEDFSSKVPYFFPLYVEGGFLRTLGDFNSSLVAHVGTDIALGNGFPRAENGLGLYAHVGPFFGIMIGKPKCRLDIRFQPSFEYCTNGALWEKTEYTYYSPEGNPLGVHSTNVDDFFSVLIVLDASVWIGHFSIGARYIPQYKGLMGHLRWRF